MKTDMTPELKIIKGYAVGILSGMTWGMDAVLLGGAMAMAPFAENPLLVAGGAILASALHDVFSAFWVILLMMKKGRIKEFFPALRTRDGRFCALAALFGGPLAMTFYVLAISEGGASLAANVTAIYPLLGTALAVLVLKEKTGIQTWLGICLCVLGILVMGHSPSSGEHANVAWGIILALVAAVGWAMEGVVCGYGMKGGKVDSLLALLIREITSAVVYVLIVTPILLKGFGNVLTGVQAIFSNASCGFLLVFVALIGMSSFGCWYTSIDSIGAAKALCLNVTYSFWSVVFSAILALFVPAYFHFELSVPVALGSFMMICGVVLASLLSFKRMNK